MFLDIAVKSAELSKFCSEWIRIEFRNVAYSFIH